MKKFLQYTFIFILIGLAVGCGKAGTGITSGLGQMDKSKIVSITIKDDVNKSVKITQALSFDRFVQAVTAAEYDSGQLDIGPPDYRSTVEIKESTSQEFLFWLTGANTGLFTKAGQNGHYRLPDASKKDLLNLLSNC
jgi:hypothetical protein